MALNRSKSRYSIKECSTCGSWYTKECCSIGNLKDQIIVPVLESSQHCAVCGTPVDGPYCHGCTLIRTKFEKDLFAYCVDNGVFQNFQDTSESSNDNTNVVNAPREPSVVDQDPAWERFKELLRKCPHHGFSLMHQLDTFYNSLSYNDQDSLNSAAGGNFLYKSPNEGLQIIENKAKVRCSRNAVMRVSKESPPTSSNSHLALSSTMAAAFRG
ncbi:hypothetical protein Tco_0572513 [Tanacetum coccineum]